MDRRFYKDYPGHCSHIAVGKQVIGRDFTIIAGPCAVEDQDLLAELAAELAPWVNLFRGGVFKGRTSPYSFAGAGTPGLEWLAAAGRRHDRPIVVEFLAPDQVVDLAEKVDVIQIGARNMYNYPLLRAAARSGKAILLKRHFSATIDELLLAAEHILAQGNSRVILCERGIRTFESRYRNCLDLTAVAVLKQLTHLPVLVDPSHAAGDSSLVGPLALAAVAAGADGLLLEVHPQPLKALSDGAQAITPGQLRQLCRQIADIRGGLGNKKRIFAQDVE